MLHTPVKRKGTLTCCACYKEAQAHNTWVLSNLPHRPAAHSPLPAAGSEPESMCIGSAARPRRPSPATFFGSGQVEVAASHVAARQPARVFVNALLSGVQQRNLERAWGRPVLDRVALIIEIFNQRARTAEVRFLASMLVPAALA